MPKAHISLVTLGVTDVARSTEFYEALGWRRSPASTDDVSFLSGGNVVLALWSAASIGDDAGLNGPHPAAYATNLATPEDVDTFIAQAAAAGATVTKPASATDWGGYSGYFRDADGHLWEVAHNPGFPMSDDGQIALPGAPGENESDA